MDAISSGMSTPIKLAQDAASAVVNAVGSVAGPIATEAGSEAHRVSSARVPPRESALLLAAADDAYVLSSSYSETTLG